MAKGSRKKRRPSGRGGAKKKSLPTSKVDGDDPAPPSAPPSAPPATSANGDKKRPGDDSELLNAAASAASGKRSRGSEAGSSEGSSGPGSGKGADGMPAAAAAAAAGDADAVGIEEGQASIKKEGPRELASASPGGGAARAVAPESAAAPGLGHETVFKEELDASMCNEMDEWIAAGGGDSVPEGESSSRSQPQEENDGNEKTGSRLIPEAQTSVLASAAASSAAAASASGMMAATDDGKDGAGKDPDQGPASCLQANEGEAASIRTEAGERSASADVVSQAPTARAITEEGRIEQAEESSEPIAGAGTGLSVTASPPLDVGAATPIPAQESPSGSYATDRATSIPALGQGMGEIVPSTQDQGAVTVGGAVVETPTAAVETIGPTAATAATAAITADPALPLVAGRDSVDGVEAPQPPPSAAASTAECATGGSDTIGSCPTNDASKEDVAVGGAVGSDQSVNVPEVLPDPATASANVVNEGATAQGGMGGSSREKTAAAKAAAEAATAAAVLASADAASAAEAAAVAVADAEAALEAVAEAEAGARVSSAERDGAETAAMPTANAPAVAAAAAVTDDGAAAPAAPDEGKAARKRAAPPAADASDGAAGPAASSLAAFPSLFLESAETGSELNAAAPTGATILTGSVSADVFSSRSAGGPCPWPGSSDGENDGDDDNDGFGGSRRSQMSVEEAAAFMNPSSTGGRGGAFASGSSWATTGTSVIDTAGAAEICAVPVTEAAAGGGPGLGGGFPSVGSASGQGGLALGGSTFEASFVGPDDFLAPASVGGMGGLNRRRVSADAVVPQSLRSGGGAAADVRELGARRATASEIVSRGGDCSGKNASGLASGATVEGPKTSAGVEGKGVTTGRSNDGDAVSGGDAGALPPTREETVVEKAPASREVQPALLVRKDDSGGSGKTAVVDAAVAAGRGVEGGAVVKNSDSAGGFAAGDSAATSCAGGEGGVVSPSPSPSRGGGGIGGGGGGAEATIPGPSGTTSRGGGCCVVS